MDIEKAKAKRQKSKGISQKTVTSSFAFCLLPFALLSAANHQPNVAVFTGDPPSEFVELYEVLQRAQSAAVDAAVIGTPCEDVDGVARSIISDAGYGEYFIHRTGHGIGLEGHEHPYLVSGNAEPLAAGHAFSIEPGIYIPGRWGARIEDIVVATEEGPLSLNTADHDLHVVEA